MINQTLFDLIHQFAGQYPIIDQIIIFCASYLGWLIIFGLGIFWLWRLNRDRDIKFLGQVLLVITAGLLAWLLAEAIKSFWPMPRPYDVIPGLSHLLTSSDPSFPSGHAAFFSGLGFGAYRFWRRLGGWLLIGALLIGLARVAAGLHWPGDILGGFAIGGLVALVLSLVAGLGPERDI